jgi:hypothetical protein
LKDKVENKMNIQISQRNYQGLTGATVVLLAIMSLVINIGAAEDAPTIELGAAKTFAVLAGTGIHQV